MTSVSMQDSYNSVFDILEYGLTKPHKTDLILEKRKGMKIFTILAAMYCSAQVIVVWFANYLIPVSSWTDSNVTIYLWETILPGSVWFAIAMAGLGIGIYILLGIIPSLIIARNTSEKSYRKVLQSVWISISFRMSFFFALAAIPSLITQISPWNHDDPITLLWCIGVFLGFLSIWITTGRVAENYGLSYWLGFIASILISLLAFAIIGIVYLQVIYNLG